MSLSASVSLSLKKKERILCVVPSIEKVSETIASDRKRCAYRTAKRQRLAGSSDAYLRQISEFRAILVDIARAT